MKEMKLPYSREEITSQGLPATPEMWEMRCDNVNYYIQKKKEAISEAADILSETQNTTQSSDSDKAPAITIKKTSKQRLKDSLPMVVEFAVYCGVSKVMVYKWGEENEGFSNLLTTLNSLSEVAINNAIQMGYIDNVYGKFLLSAMHNYRERSDVTTNDKELPQPLLSGRSND